MKNKFLTLILFSFIITSCSDDFIEIPLLDKTNNGSFYKNNQQVQSAASILYSRPWWGYNYRFANCVETLSGGVFNTGFDGNFREFITAEITANNGYNNAGYESLYSVVAISNSLLFNLKDAGAEITPSVLNHARGQAYFIRATAYFYLVRLYGAIPISTEREQYASKKINFYRNTISSVYDFIEADLNRAAENLLDDAPKGEVSKMAAYAMLAKLYNYKGEHSKAAENALKVINSGKYALRPNYGDLFNKPQFDNNEESIFALQWTTNGRQFYVTNSNQIDLAGNSILTGFEGYSAYRPPLALQKAYEPGDNRKDYTLFEPGKLYPEYDTKGGGFRLEEDSPNSMDRTNANFRKYIVGSPNEYPQVYNFGTDKSTVMLRYADILMVYAESFMNGGDFTNNPLALDAFNKVRRRAGLSDVAEITTESLLKERYIEFVLEGNFYFDLQRLNRAKVDKFVRDQKRDILYTSVFPNTLVEGRADPKYPVDFNIDGKVLRLPIPQKDIDLNPNMKLDPVPYQQ